MSFFGPPNSPSLSRIERKLDLIMQHLGIEVPTGLSPQVLDAIQNGRKIEAIKFYREETGAGLREAKETIEGYM